MTIKGREEYKVLGILTATAVVVATFVYLFPQLENVGAISSREIDSLLYRRLDEYQQAYQRSEQLREIVTKALTSPGNLRNDERRIYIEHERMFFSGWEAAWEQHVEGYFDEERFSVWDEWYVTEALRRPRFAWSENRDMYPAAFADHVDLSLEEIDSVAQ